MKIFEKVKIILNNFFEEATHQRFLSYFVESGVYLAEDAIWGGFLQMIELNLCNIFSVMIFKKTLFICIMTLNRVKIERAVTFMKYLADVVSLIFQPKTLIWNKITFPASNSLNHAELVQMSLKSISINIHQYPFFYPFYWC